MYLTKIKVLCACFKNLLLEYDKQAEQLDLEKDRATNLEHQIDDLTRQLQTSTQQVAYFVTEQIIFMTNMK